MRDLFPKHDPANPEATRGGLIFAECHIRYRSPVHFDEELAVECSIGEIRRSAFQMNFEMRVERPPRRRGLRLARGLRLREAGAARLPEPLRGALEEAAA